MSSNPTPSREQLLYWLHEAAEIEHNLMCCYLYAQFSLKGEPHDASWSDEQRAAVGRWRAILQSIALEEMTHLSLVANLASAIGGTPHFHRPMFPIESGPYPADFVIRLQGFSRETVEHFMFLERPRDAAIADGLGFVPARSYSRGGANGEIAERVSPGAQDYATVGELYDCIEQGLVAYAQAHGEQALFAGDPRAQVDDALVRLPGLRAIGTLADARAALHTIVAQGEGARESSADSHYAKFSRVQAELAALAAADERFVPAWPCATNPVMNRPPTPMGKLHINHPHAAPWLDLSNSTYTLSLRTLLQGFAATQRQAKRAWLQTAFDLMRALTPMAQALAQLPASVERAGVTAGLTFTSLRTLALLPASSGAQVVLERLGQLIERTTVQPLPAEVQTLRDEACVNLRRARERLASLADAALPASPAEAAAVVAAPVSAPVVTTPVVSADGVEHAPGQGIDILFDAKRCIHARHCVLGAPSVFMANTPGRWIYPDTMPVEAVVAVAHNCPSGAIGYRRHDGGPQETAPPVNTLRVRENGPNAVHAPIVLAGAPIGFRATLCRCGQSQNKPFCDGAHVAAGFTASGEPATQDAPALAQRGGTLHVNPQRNGPLEVLGNLELCAGTGRTIKRVSEVYLCRCGHSKNKPYCDGSHAAAGFVADGAD
jgi:CDGSH-type Zn-finger protein/uncharacterized Fe-S cluster protein YjdI